MMYMPEGFARGRQMLADGATTFYMVCAFYAPQAKGAERSDDSILPVKWSPSVLAVPGKDSTWPLPH